MRILVVLSLLPLAVRSEVARAVDTYPRQPGIDAVHYAFRLTLSDSSDDIAGEATVSIRFVRDGVGELWLDLESAAGGKGMTVAGVASGGVAVAFTHTANRLTIRLPQPPSAGELRRFVVTYHGTPSAGLHIGANKYGERGFFSDNWPDKAHRWLPTIDHPSDKATSEFIVTAPARYQVVSNGLLVEESDVAGGMRETHWVQSVPIAPWLYTLGVARFAVEHAGSVAGTPLEYWVYPQDRVAGFRDFGAPTPRALAFFSEHIGPYAYEKLANVQSPALGGGMEAASAIAYGENEIGRPRLFEIVVHEIAHQWFGNAVTERDWNDVWLSEGFATYFTLLFTEHDAGRDAFVDGLRQARAKVFAFDSAHVGYRVVHENLADMSQVTSSQTYQKGAWTLHMLRSLIGTDLFWAGIREYYATYRNGNASTADFRRIMEAQSGMNLAGFFDQWLLRSGHPVVEGTWSYDDTAHRLVVDLTQTQPGESFQLALDIGITNDSPQPARMERVVMSQRVQRFEVALDRAPSTVVLDPGTALLMESRLVRR